MNYHLFNYFDNEFLAYYSSDDYWSKIPYDVHSHSHISIYSLYWDFVSNRKMYKHEGNLIYGIRTTPKELWFDPKTPLHVEQFINDVFPNGGDEDIIYLRDQKIIMAEFVLTGNTIVVSGN